MGTEGRDVPLQAARTPWGTPTPLSLLRSVEVQPTRSKQERQHQEEAKIIVKRLSHNTCWLEHVCYMPGSVGPGTPKEIISLHPHNDSVRIGTTCPKDELETN